MTKEVLIGMLKQGKNGEEILTILDGITRTEATQTTDNNPCQVVGFDGRSVAL